MRGAIFDVDGTLLDSMQVWWDVVVDFFKEHGVELPYEEAKEYKERIKYEGKKQENSKKFVHNRHIAKISEKKRQSARNTLKQSIYKDIANEDE